MLTIYDAVNWQTIPPKEPILVYVDGDYVTYPAALALQPPLWWTVTTTGRSVADICDCESGDALPSTAAFGVKMGWWHTVYCSLSMFPEVVAEMKAQGSPKWSWFAADPTGVPHLPKGASACQYAWHSLGQCPADYDMSIATVQWVQQSNINRLMKGARVMGITQMANGKLAIDAIGAAGTPSAGHQLVFTVDPTTDQSEVIDATDGVGNKGPNNSLYTVQ